MGCPLPLNIKEQGGGVRPAKERAPGGVLLPSGVGLPPFLVGIGFVRRKERGEEGKRGPAPLALNQFGLGLGGRPHTPLASLYFH